MKQHKEWHLISAFIDNELKSDEKSTVESHITKCSSCRNEYDQLLRIKDLVDTSLRHSMPADLIDNLIRQAEKTTLSERIRRWFQAPQVWIPAGSLATVLLIIGIWMGLTPEQTANTLPLEPLLAAHSRYIGESLVPRRHTSSSNFSIHLARYDDITN
ncbi:hypothetical protein BVX98_07380 [bacterium F11]|nr:hypothetical protein BVX98_07380 [bacterium F11]